MRYCLSCKYLSPHEALFCAHCGKSFGGRRCPQHHLSPPDARACIQCGSDELTEPAACFSPLALVKGAFLLAGVAALIFAGPPLFRAAMDAAPRSAPSSPFRIPSFIWFFERGVILLVVGGLASAVLPPQVRQALWRGCGRLLESVLSLLASVIRFFSIVLFSRGRRW